MSTHIQKLQTFAFIALEKAFQGKGKSLIFRVTIDESQERLVITEDLHGVIDRIREYGLAGPPELASPGAFPTQEDYDAYWREVLSKVEVEWDGTVLNTGSLVSLSFPTDDGTTTPLCKWEYPTRLEFSIEQAWILEPQPV